MRLELASLKAVMPSGAEIASTALIDVPGASYWCAGVTTTSGELPGRRLTVSGEGYGGTRDEALEAAKEALRRRLVP